jgi:hypothetical protein
MADHRDDDEPDGASPSPGVLAAFRAQATPELYKAAERAARKWAQLPRRAGRRVDNLYLRELVNDAIQDTLISVNYLCRSTTTILAGRRQVGSSVEVGSVG